VILVDDGLATGSTMRAAVALRQQSPARIVWRPVSAPQTCDEYRLGADEIVCAIAPEPFYGVGQCIETFHRQLMKEVSELLEKARVTHARQMKNRELVHAE